MTATHGEGPYGNAVGVTTPVEHKMAQVAEFVKTTTKNIIRPGVLYNGDTSLVAGTAGMSYDVDAFTIVTQRSATSGVVKWANDGTVNVATTAAPGSNSRYDVVYAWHREYALDGVDSNPVIGVVQGTAAASPTVPSLAAYPGAVELARILVPAGVTATNSGTTFTQTAPFTSGDGGVVAFRSTTEMDLWVTALTGQMAVVPTTGVTYRYSGSAWKGWESDWIAYTPTWTAVTTNPVLGNGTLSGVYKYVGGMVEIEVVLVAGSTTTFGTGEWRFALPLTAYSTLNIFNGLVLDSGTRWYTDVTPTTNTIGSTTVMSIATSGGTAGANPSTPMTWAANDALYIRGNYRPA